jgi:hypothetical protein
MSSERRICVACHEAGHVVAAWAVHGVTIREVRLHPEGGGTTYLDGNPSTPLGDLLISMAGGEVDNATMCDGACYEPGNMHDLFDTTEILRSMGIDTDEMGSRYMAVMDRASRVCERFVRKHLGLINKLAQALDERGTLSGDEIAAILPAELRDSLYRPKLKRPNKRQVELFG